MTRLRSAHSTGLLLAAALLAAGCGTTVPLAAQQSVGTETGGLGTPQVGATAAPGTTTGSAAVGGGGAVAGPGTVTGGGTTGAVAGSSGTSGGQPAVGGGTTGGVRSAVPATGPGWTAKEVFIGVVTQKDTQRAFAAFGVDSVDPGNTEEQARAAANAINAGGGILGRRVVLKFKDIAIIETNQNGDTVGQSVCSYFTQDIKVIAVWNISTQLDQSPTMRNCLAKAGTAFFSTAARAIDDGLMASLAPSYYHAFGVSWTRLAPAFVSRLKAQGYFTGWDTTLRRPNTAKPVVGVLVEDEPQGKRTADALQRALAAAGLGRTFVYSYGRPEDGQQDSMAYFKGNGVTHVIVTDVELSAFQQAAASQQYSPRYGITTYNAPYPNLEGSGLTPPGANDGAMGVGWAPALDVSAANEKQSPPGWARCSKAMTKQQQSFGGKRLAQAWASMMCDSLFLMDAGAEAGGGFTVAAMRAGVVAVGPRFASAFSYGTSLGSATPYVAGVVRDLQWVSDCSCMRYGSGQVALPR
jgi:hypothetical protein